MGEEAGVRLLVDRFYTYMDTLPEARVIREMHAPDLTEAREKLSDFLVGWSGGPQLYVAKHGHPRLRMRHMPFPIGEEERDQWMLCMQKAIEECIADAEVREHLAAKFFEIADFMRNMPEEKQGENLE
ncbi:MAG: group II truncated hemoglobin [Bdellovibrionales bacterium]|nr:group II truncated hemoglobin [Bdellovibrionales bacterium]